MSDNSMLGKSVILSAAVMNYRFCLAFIVVFLFMASDPAFGRPLKYRRNKVIFSLLGRKENGRVTSEFSLKAPLIKEARVFTLTDPNRVVIDLKGFMAGRNRTYRISGNPMVEKLRVGVHKDKYRLVLDLLTPEIPKYRFLEKTNYIRIRLSLPSDSSGGGRPDAAELKRHYKRFIRDARIIVPEAKPDSPTVAVLAAAIPSEDLEPAMELRYAKKAGMLTLVSLGAKSHQESTSDEEKIQAAAVPVKPVPVFGYARLSPEYAGFENINTELPVNKRTGSIVLSLTGKPNAEQSQPPGIPEEVKPQAKKVVSVSFERLKDLSKGVVKIALNSKPVYSIIKKDSTTYLLKTDGVSLSGAHLALPFFPPSDFEGIRWVNPAEDKSGSSFLIGVEENVRLSSFVVGNEIVLSPGR